MSSPWLCSTKDTKHLINYLYLFICPQTSNSLLLPSHKLIVLLNTNPLYYNFDIRVFGHHHYINCKINRSNLKPVLVISEYISVHLYIGFDILSLFINYYLIKRNLERHEELKRNFFLCIFNSYDEY